MYLYPYLYGISTAICCPLWRFFHTGWEPDREAAGHGWWLFRRPNLSYCRYCYFPQVAWSIFFHLRGETATSALQEVMDTFRSFVEWSGSLDYPPFVVVYKFFAVYGSYLFPQIFFASGEGFEREPIKIHSCFQRFMLPLKCQREHVSAIISDNN